MCADCAGAERRSRKRTFANAMGEIQLKIMDSVLFPWIMTAAALGIFGAVASVIEAIRL